MTDVQGFSSWLDEKIALQESSLRLRSQQEVIVELRPLEGKLAKLKKARAQAPSSSSFLQLLQRD